MQACHGFALLTKMLTNQGLENETLDSFCDKFLKNPEVMLNGKVHHLLFDRVHFEAALEQDCLYKIGGDEFSFRDILKCMLQKLATHPECYSPIVREQLCLRLKLVENDLQERFKTYYEAVQSKNSNGSGSMEGGIFSRPMSTVYYAMDSFCELLFSQPTNKKAPPPVASKKVEENSSAP